MPYNNIPKKNNDKLNLNSILQEFTGAGIIAPYYNGLQELVSLLLTTMVYRSWYHCSLLQWSTGAGIIAPYYKGYRSWYHCYLLLGSTGAEF
jgi:hypothetical protein